MRCPVCVRYVNNCTCNDGDWDRVVRKSFDDAARHAREKREANVGKSKPTPPVKGDA